MLGREHIPSREEYDIKSGATTEKVDSISLVVFPRKIPKFEIGFSNCARYLRVRVMFKVMFSSFLNARVPQMHTEVSDARGKTPSNTPTNLRVSTP